MGIFRKLFGNRQSAQQEIRKNDKSKETLPPRPFAVTVQSNAVTVEKVPCKRCGTLILPSTAAKNDGCCRNPNCQSPKPTVDSRLATYSSRQPSGETLCDAAETGDFNEVRRLLSQGVSPHYRTGPKKVSPLILAAHKGHATVVRLLIEAGADINEANTDGLTPLIAAAMNGHIEAVRLLCEHKADPNSQTVNDRYSALMLAKNSEVFKTLLAQGANTSLRNKWGDTVLEIAQMKKNTEFISLLESSKKDNVDSTTDHKIRHIRKIQGGLYGSGNHFDTTFESLFAYLKDNNPEIRTLASSCLADNPTAVARLISIYTASISTDQSRAVQAGRVLGCKLSHNEAEMVSEENTVSIYGVSVAFVPYSCSFCGKLNLGIPVPTRWLSFYGRKDREEAKNALPVRCDFCNKEFFLCWD